MVDSNMLKVLLYSDGTQHSFSAAVYAANLFYKIPNMHLTVLHVQEKIDGSVKEDSDLPETWSANPNLDWVKHLMDEADSDKRRQYSEIFAKTQEIFTERGQAVNQQVIFSASAGIPDTAKAILGYAERNEFELIIMGTRGLTSLKGLIHGSLAHSVLNKSRNIPVLLIKKLSQDFVDRYCSAADAEGHCYLPKISE
ncbi:universal stress protein [Desulfosporosinus sp. Sb-LF]|uniref:universal stress protein n=1 Tax=Desulfosporosinus sp. Sb-LF TaxID=2560027 RepID=UPI00107F6E5C|nr:universal stress protein [Desulfosporosinus sp. Sb-LF]TGE31636.1 universal stress protein [Desulfosporosinus sp. Sb-LF]